MQVRSYKMDYTYEIITGNLGEVLKRTDKDGLVAWIPMTLGNSDYQAYLDRDKPKVALSTPSLPE